MSSPPIVAANQLCFGYADMPLFNDLSFLLSSGITIVRGGDGRGKTTLLRLLAGQLAPEGGHIDIKGIRSDADPISYRHQVCYTDPRTDAFDQLSVPAYLATVKEQHAGFDEAALPELLEGLSLTPHLEKQLFMLSTGSKRKVYLAAAFAADATVTLLDDPFAGLDKASIQFVCQTLTRLSASPQRAWVAAFYDTPPDLAATQVIDLGD